MEKRLSDALGLVVSIDHRGEGGVVSVRYRNLDQLDDLAQRLGSKHWGMIRKITPECDRQRNVAKC